MRGKLALGDGKVVVGIGVERHILAGQVEQIGNRLKRIVDLVSDSRGKSPHGGQLL